MAWTDRLCPVEEAGHEVVGAAPVQLEPAGRVAHDGSGLFHAPGCLAREDIRNTQFCGGAGDSEIGLGVHEFERADGGGENGGGVAVPEEFNPQVAGGHVAQDAGEYLPAIECVPVRGRCRFGAARAGDVRPGLGGHGGSGGVGQRAGDGGHGGFSAPGTTPVDRGLGVPTETGCGLLLRHRQPLVIVRM